jgi:serine/threonine protein kinase
VRVCTACERKTHESGRFCPDCGAALRDLARAETDAASGDGALAATGTANSTSSATRLIGMVLDGQFKIESIIGGGAFGTVYKGTQVGLNRTVAIKVPTYEIAADPIMSKRFQREARSAARVHHPGVVAIHAVGEIDDGRPYLAMQYVEGQPLDKVLADGPIQPLRALRLARMIASALSETHAAGVVHRDLKPTNIMWRRDRNGDDRITLVDFGIAVCKPGNADATRLTADGLIGTPHYMSPEQAHGEQVDARADLYALGCLLFELVTGSPPFEGSGFEVLLAHLGRPAPLPSEKNPSVPASLDRLCAALMQKKPENRPHNADELVAHLDEAITELEAQASRAVSTVNPAPIKRPKLRTLQTKVDLPEGTEVPRHRRKRQLAVGITVAAIAAAATSFAVFELRGKQTAHAEPVEEHQDPDPLVGRRRSLFSDNGEMRVQLLVPDPLVAGQEIRSRIDLKNKLGQPVVADEIVLTIADKTGAAKGLTARPRRSAAGSGSGSGSGPGSATPPTPGRYYFRFTFPEPGTYVLRVFPPSIDSSFEIPIEVK